MANSDVLFISLDSCRYDTFEAAYRRGKLPHLQGIGPLHRALAPSHFTYGSHAAFGWVSPGVIGSREPWLNPKAGKLFRMAFAGHTGVDGEGAFRLIDPASWRAPPAGLSHPGKWLCQLVRHRDRDRFRSGETFRALSLCWQHLEFAEPARLVRATYG